MKSSIIILNSILFGFSAGIFHIQEISAFICYWIEVQTETTVAKIKKKSHNFSSFYAFVSEIAYMCIQTLKNG